MATSCPQCRRDAAILGGEIRPHPGSTSLAATNLAPEKPGIRESLRLHRDYRHPCRSNERQGLCVHRGAGAPRTTRSRSLQLTELSGTSAIDASTALMRHASKVPEAVSQAMIAAFLIPASCRRESAVPASLGCGCHLCHPGESCLRAATIAHLHDEAVGKEPGESLRLPRDASGRGIAGGNREPQALDFGGDAIEPDLLSP
jgi:hypothetical protein